MESSAHNYRSYLLRIRYSCDGMTWRAMLEEIGTQECHHFVNPEELVTFFKMQMMTSAQAGDCRNNLSGLDEM